MKGKRIAVTRGTDPHIFLMRTLAEHGLTDKDAKLVLLLGRRHRTPRRLGVAAVPNLTII